MGVFTVNFERSPLEFVALFFEQRNADERTKSKGYFREASEPGFNQRWSGFDQGGRRGIHLLGSRRSRAVLGQRTIFARRRYNDTRIPSRYNVPSATLGNDRPSIRVGVPIRRQIGAKTSHLTQQLSTKHTSNQTATTTTRPGGRTSKSRPKKMFSAHELLYFALEQCITWSIPYVDDIYT